MRFNRMLLAIVALAASMTASAVNSPSEIQGNYCDGYKDGYRQGYTQVAGAGPPPLSSVCPGTPSKKDEDKRSEYERGFQRGLKDGMRDGAR
jgi:flagellar biosynthesis/type III secretory pathway protein FliH